MSSFVTGLLDPCRLLFLLLGTGIAILWRRRRAPIGRIAAGGK
jgi:hypothetical protein